jgi:hypothetical protein
MLDVEIGVVGDVDVYRCGCSGVVQTSSKCVCPGTAEFGAC